MTLINATKSSAAIQEIISSAQTYIILVSPYNSINSQLLGYLKRADQNDIKIKFICRDEPKTINYLKNIFSDFKNLNLYALKRLHAKLYMNESEGIVTSLNLMETSQINNWELGFSFELEGHLKNDVISEVNMMIDNADIIINNFERIKLIKQTYVTFLSVYVSEQLKTDKVRVFEAEHEYDFFEYDERISINDYPIQGISTEIKYSGKNVYVNLDSRNILYSRFQAELNVDSLKERYKVWIGPSVISLKRKDWVTYEWDNMGDLEKAKYTIDGLKGLYRIIYDFVKLHHGRIHSTP